MPLALAAALPQTYLITQSSNPLNVFVLVFVSFFVFAIKPVFLKQSPTVPSTVFLFVFAAESAHPQTFPNHPTHPPTSHSQPCQVAQLGGLTINNPPPQTAKTYPQPQNPTFKISSPTGWIHYQQTTTLLKLPTHHHLNLPRTQPFKTSAQLGWLTIINPPPQTANLSSAPEPNL